MRRCLNGWDHITFVPPLDKFNLRRMGQLVMGSNLPSRDYSDYSNKGGGARLFNCQNLPLPVSRVMFAGGAIHIVAQNCFIDRLAVLKISHYVKKTGTASPSYPILMA